MNQTVGFEDQDSIPYFKVDSLNELLVPFNSYEKGERADELTATPFGTRFILGVKVN